MPDISGLVQVLLFSSIGYRDRNGVAVSSREDFLHVGSNESLVIDPWRPSQPNAKNDDQCIIAYLGNDPAESW
jgi:hypothetical protein